MILLHEATVADLPESIPVRCTWNDQSFFACYVPHCGSDTDALSRSNYHFEMMANPVPGRKIAEIAMYQKGTILESNSSPITVHTYSN